MLKNAWISKKFQLKWKIVNHLMRPKQRASLRKLFSLPPISNPPPSDKILLRPWKKKIWSYTEIYRQLLSKCCPNVFSGTKQKYVWWKICKVRKVFDCVTGAYYFQCQVSRGSKKEWGFLSETVLWKEWSFLLVYVGFATFCWKIWKLEKNSGDVHWNVWVNT